MFCLCLQPAHAQQDLAAAQEAEPAANSKHTAISEQIDANYRLRQGPSLANVAQLLLGLLLVLALILILAWLLKRLPILPNQQQPLKVIASLHLGHRERAVLVQVGDEQILLGVAQGHVSLIKKLDQPLQQAPIKNANFQKTLEHWIKARKKT